MAEPTLYERLGGIFAIAAVIDSFSDRLLNNPKIVDVNPELHEWHTVTYHTRLAGLKWGRTWWLAMKAGADQDVRCALTEADWVVEHHTVDHNFIPDLRFSGLDRSHRRLRS